MHTYWSVSRQRFDSWQAGFSNLHRELELAGASQRVRLWQRYHPLLEEVFLSDIPVRIYAHCARILERNGVDEDSGPITHSVYVAHEDIRHRCMRILLIPGLPVEKSIQLNRIRHAIEHWTDKFLAILSSTIEITNHCTQRMIESTEYGFRSDLVEEFLFERRESLQLSGTSSNIDIVSHRELLEKNDLEIQILSSSCQRWIEKNCRSLPATPHENRGLGEAMLSFTASDKFSPWPVEETKSEERVQSLLFQANEWVNDLLEEAPNPK
jgi:hypothetical protein